MVEYIKNSIDIIVSIKLDEKLRLYKNNIEQLGEAKKFEVLLQKEEESIRQHISIEHQFRIQCEKYAEKIDILENDKIKLINIIVRKINNINKIFFYRKKKEKNKMS